MTAARRSYFLVVLISMVIWQFSQITEHCQEEQGAPSALVVIAVLPTMMLVGMGSAGGARILESPRAESLHGLPRVTRCASNHLDAVRMQDPYCPLAHVPRDHVGDSHPRERAGNVRFAAAALGRIHSFFGSDLPARIQAIHHEMLTVSEMLIHLTFSRRDRYFHQLLSFFMYDEFSAFDAEELSIDDGIGDFASGRFHDAPECLSGNSHSKGCCPLVETLQVGEANGFRLIQAEHHFLEGAARHTCRLESAGGHSTAYPALGQGTRHNDTASASGIFGHEDMGIEERSVLWQQTFSKYRRTVDESRCPVQPSTRFTPSLLSSQRS